MGFTIDAEDAPVKNAFHNATIHVTDHVGTGPLCFTNNGQIIASLNWFDFWEKIACCTIAVRSCEKVVNVEPGKSVQSSMMQGDILLVFHAESDIVKFILTWG